jgi:small-conductance mechanosensitive channel
MSKRRYSFDTFCRPVDSRDRSTEPVEQSAQESCNGRSAGQPDDGADRGQKCTPTDNECERFASVCAERDQDAQLTRTLRDVARQNTVHADPGENQTDAAEAADQVSRNLDRNTAILLTCLHESHNRYPRRTLPPRQGPVRVTRPSGTGGHH